MGSFCKFNAETSLCHTVIEMAKISFKGVSISNMSIIVDMNAKSVKSSNSTELKAILHVPVKNYGWR